MLLCVGGRWPWGKLMSLVIGQVRLPVGEPRRKGSQQLARGVGVCLWLGAGAWDKTTCVQVLNIPNTCLTLGRWFYLYEPPFLQL